MLSFPHKIIILFYHLCLSRVQIDQCHIDT